MPSFAYLNRDLKCPDCGSVLINTVAFAWGFCPRYAPVKEYLYKINDPIYWKRCQNHGIPSWTYFSDGVSCNMGDPSIENLIVRDTSHYWQAPVTCNGCQQHIAGSAVKITGGIISSAWAYKAGELDNEVSIYLLEPDASLRPMPEWNDHAMNMLKDC